VQVRDISTNEAWLVHAAHVPVLAVQTAAGEEQQLPRPQPRVTADRLEKHIAAALAATGGAPGTL
jgi:hypothetical protein